MIKLFKFYEIQVMGNLVIKDNALIEASHRLSEAEQRLILLAIVKARKHCNSVQELRGKELIIHADDYVQTFGVTRQVAYRVLKQSVMGLFEAKWGYKYINDKGNKVVAYERFTQSAKYIETEGVVSFKFADAIIPFLVELEKRFTTYEIAQVAKLSSQYGMRLYEFFMQHLDKKNGNGWLEISLDELRFRFGLLPTEYKTMSNFKAYVLDFALKQINEYTDLTVTYEQRKQGRTIIGFKFEFSRKVATKPKKTPKDITDRDTKTVDLFDGLTDLERQTIQNCITEHIERLEEKGEIVSDFHHQNIIKKAVSERWGLDVLAEKKKKKQSYETKKVIDEYWKEIPNLTRFRHKQDSSIWFKDVDMLRNEKNRRVVPITQFYILFQELEVIKE